MSNSFFDKLSANLTNATRTVQQNLKNSTDASKLMSQITAENKNIQENLNAIGKLYYDICKDEPDEAFREMVDAIKKSEKRITELQESVKIIRAREPELVPVPEETPSASGGVKSQVRPSAMVCMGCGNTYTEGNAFCPVCGQKLVPQYQDTAAAAAAPAQTADDVQTRQETPANDTESEIIDAEIIEEPVNLNKPAASEEAKFCPYCGKKISVAGQAFCDNCGHAV